MAFEENNPGFWTPENEDDSITGILINIQEDVGTNKSMLYTIEQDKIPTNIWGFSNIGPENDWYESRRSNKNHI